MARLGGDLISLPAPAENRTELELTELTKGFWRFCLSGLVRVGGVVSVKLDYAERLVAVQCRWPRDPDPYRGCPVVAIITLGPSIGADIPPKSLK